MIKMNNCILLYTLLLTFISCTNKSVLDRGNDLLKVENDVDSLSENLEFENPFIKSFRWDPKDSKGVQIWFTDKKVCYLLSVHCLYMFPVVYHDNEAIMYWGGEMDCRYDAKLKNSFGGVKAPEVGSAFAKYTLVENDVIRVEYYFSEWVSAYIESESNEQYIHFPDTFYYQIN